MTHPKTGKVKHNGRLYFVACDWICDETGAREWNIYAGLNGEEVGSALTDSSTASYSTKAHAVHDIKEGGWEEEHKDMTAIAERAAKKFDEAGIDKEIAKRVAATKVGLPSAMGARPVCRNLPQGTVAAYIKMNGRTYYIDDSTNEAIMENWPTK